MKPLKLEITLTLDEDILTDLVRRAVNSAMGIDEQREARLRASQHALFGGQKPPGDKGLLIDLRETAKLLGLSQRTVWGMAKNGRMPKPIKIGRATRWSHEELREGVKSGGPPLNDWTWPK